MLGFKVYTYEIQEMVLYHEKVWEVGASGIRQDHPDSRYFTIRGSFLSETTQTTKLESLFDHKLVAGSNKCIYS